MTTPRDRVRAYRERRRSGAGILPFVPVQDEVGLIEMLRDMGLVSEFAAAVGSPAVLSRAVGRMLDAAVHEHQLKMGNSE